MMKSRLESAMVAFGCNEVVRVEEFVREFDGRFTSAIGKLDLSAACRNLDVQKADVGW
jgi:hypothetical protein